MAIVSMTDHTVTLGGTALTGVSSVMVDVSANANDISAHGSGWQANTGGLKSGKLTLVLFNDYAAGNLDSVLWGFGVGSTQTIAVRSNSGGKTTSNPEYTGSVVLTELQPINAKVGDVPQQSILWPSTGTVTRATS